jgi:hypothetical protein
VLKRLVWRLRHGCWSTTGLGRRTKLLTEPWDDLPVAGPDAWAFFFHPEDLTADGIRNVADNLARLRAAGAEIVTASELHRRLSLRRPSGRAGGAPPRR